MTLKSDKDPIALDPDQRKAVKHFEGPALVVAGPGSGKTTVIIERILNLIENHNVDPEQILVIAFSNAAIDEMNSRFPKGRKPKICTLHVFGKDLIKAHYKQANFAHEPNNIWDDKEIGQIINREKLRLKTENEEKPVAIYKIEDETTHQCYIGQTIDPDRRKDEHFNHSSNRRLREAIQQKGKKAFDFTYEWVAGIEADREETYRINSYRRRAAVNLNQGHEQTDKEYSNIPITIYKIKSPTAVTCYFGQTTDLESIEKSEGFEVIGEEKTREEASIRVEQEIKKHKNWAVFNDEDPLHARDSTRRRIEVFCKYFDASYDEVLEHTQKFEHEMRIFDGMSEDIIKVKSQVYTDRFKPEKISDPVLRAFAKRYETYKTEARAIDFLDMLICSADLLENNQDLLQDYRKKYHYVHVDEFQDISPIDFRLINLFRDNLFAVGDDDQAIYGFRGADSEIMQNFREKEDVTEYKVTRNYRSSSIIVKHAKALIAHNPHRISKNLRAQNSAQSRIEVLKTSRDTVKGNLLNELFPLVTTCETHFKENTPDLNNSLLQELTVPQQIGILARNWHEVNPIQTHLNSAFKNKGFQICWSDSDDQGKRKLIMRRSQKEIEISTIHSAKGREWNKVILLVNTMTSPNGKPSMPDSRNALEDERRLFYVAVTRAKQELVVLDSGNCKFISEFQNVPPTKEELIEAFKTELTAREPKLKKDLENASKAALIKFQSKLKKKLQDASNAAHKQYKDRYGLERLRSNVTRAKNAAIQLETQLPIDLKAANEDLLEELIPVLDAFESRIINGLETTGLDNVATDLAELHQSLQHTQQQLLRSLYNHGLKPIESPVGTIFNPSQHKEISPATYSDEVPEGRVAREEQRGYLLNNQVVRKAHVVISKKRQQVDTLLSRDFAQPVRFVTYAGILDLTDIETLKDEISGIGSRGEKLQLQKLNVLFVFPRDDMASVKSHIKRRQIIADRNLQPIKLLPERFHIVDDILKSLMVKPEAMESTDLNRTIRLVTRSGHILNGYLWDFDEDCLYMSINDKVVVVYRPGILDFKTQMWNKIIKAYKNGSLVTGHVIKTINNGFCVKFGSLYGFLPKSQVELASAGNLDSYVGKIFKMKIVNLSKTNNNINIVLSRRAYLEAELAQKRSKTIKPMEETKEALPVAEVLPLNAEADGAILCESINSTDIKLIEKAVDTPPPMPEEFTGLLKPQIQELILETLKTDIPRESLKTVNDNSYLMPQESDNILKTHIQNLKPALREENVEPPTKTVNNISDQPTEPIHSESPEKTSNNPSNIEISDEEKPPRSKIHGEHKNLGYYLRKFRRFVVRKLK